MHTLTIEVDDEQFVRLAAAGESYLAYGKGRKHGAEVQVEALIRDTLAGQLTPVLGPAPHEVFAG